MPLEYQLAFKRNLHLILCSRSNQLLGLEKLPENFDSSTILPSNQHWNFPLYIYIFDFDSPSLLKSYHWSPPFQWKFLKYANIWYLEVPGVCCVWLKKAKVCGLMNKLKGHILTLLESLFPNRKTICFSTTALNSTIYESLFAPSFWLWTHGIWLHRGIHHPQKVISHKMSNFKMRTSRIHVQMNLFLLSMGQCQMWWESQSLFY